MNDGNPRAVDAAIHHRFPDCVRDRDEAGNSRTVFESYRPRRKRDAASHDQRDLRLSDEGDHSESMRASIMSMNDVNAPCAHSRTDAPGRADVPVRRHRDSGDGESSRFRFFDERRRRRPDQKLFMAPILEAQGKEENLPLTTAPGSAGIEMQNP